MRIQISSIVGLAGAWLLLTAATAQPPLEDAVLQELNFARQHPREYADELRDSRDFYDGNVFRRPDDPAGVLTQEGVTAVDEAIAFLERQAPLPPLAPGDVLALAARDHAVEQASGELGHASPDGAMPGERVRRRGGDIYVGETIAYGPSDGRSVVRNLIVDDGVPGRGHRALIFSNMYHYAGVGCGDHARYHTVCVVDYAGTSDGNPVLPGAAQSASR